jgi:hypothetical protein
MAIAPRDIPVHRSDVYMWYVEWSNTPAADAQSPRARQGSFKSFVEDKVAELELPDTMVNTTSMDGMESETSIVDMIMLDLPSYLPTVEDADAPSSLA